MPKVILANGCFDVLHYGHVLHLRAARKLGAKLIVSVTRDIHVNKGLGRPVFPEDERMDMVLELKCGSGVILADNALDALQKVKPHIFVKDAEYEGRIEPAHLQYCKENNIEIVFTREKRYSSTKLLDHYRLLVEGDAA